jgi:2-keto-3-deoxy-L-rhamnonate aldolase RhmA
MPRIHANRLKARLNGGGCAFGTWVMFVRTPALMRMIAAAELDFAFIDMEHSGLGWETVADMCDMARAAGVTPIVRPYSRDPGVANRAQDIGAQGLMLPNVTERSEIDEALRYMRYPPAGARGVTVGGAPSDYLFGPGASVQREVDANTTLVVQVESRQGLDRIDTLLEGGGIDLIEFGRNDFSTSAGVPFETRHALVLDALDHVIARCHEYGVPVGVNASSIEDAEDLIRRGVRCISYLTDKALLNRAYAAASQALRGLT